MTAIVVVGLVVADVVVYQQIRSYLSSQIDQELLAIQPGAFSLTSSGNIVFVDGQSLPEHTYIRVTLQNNEQVGTNNAAVHLNISAAKSTALFGQVESGTSVSTSVFSANATGPAPLGGIYRVRAELFGVRSLSGFGPRIPALALIALPLSSFAGTMNKLLFVDLIVTAVVIGALVILGYIVVLIGMRPLEDIEVIAEAIAAGDLSRRIEQDNLGTEVGRLGAALNTMLGYIERAFTRQQASEDQLRQFLADASHELRTPVTSIRGYSELFRRGAQSRPEDLALAMRRIEDESIRMGVLVDDLLLLARLDQGRPLERLPVRIGDIVTDAAADVQVVAPDRQVSVDVDEDIVVTGDEQRLRQVVMNLLQNALRHTPSTTPIEVGVHLDRESVEFRVTDHGEGIPTEHLGHIFERFYRADPSRTRGSGGSGLGLAIVSSIVSAHHGDVRVESEVGVGTTFVVRLPQSEVGREGQARDIFFPDPVESLTDH
ncbi:MAG TPA: ATP-binding protein [Acidimicrobiales bacterium]|nr:ATP-binding protein [Acidimicrobiales bacterium]